MADRPTLLTIKQFSEANPAFSESGIRWLRFRSATNGFSSAFVTVGRRVLVDVDAFFRCIAEQNREGVP